MLLADELLACECDKTPDQFRDLLINRLTERFSGLTIDRLVCSPDDALRYCDDIRQITDSKVLYDGVILKALMNIRKSADCPKGLRGSGKPKRNLKLDLPTQGCDLTPEAFKELAVDCFASMYKSKTIDEITCYPQQASALCNFVRTKAKAKSLTDDTILATLMNVRKAS